MLSGTGTLVSFKNGIITVYFAFLHIPHDYNFLCDFQIETMSRQVLARNQVAKFVLLCC